MDKPVHLGLSIQEISKKLMYEFWYDYTNPKYQYNVKLCYMDTLRPKTYCYLIDDGNSDKKAKGTKKCVIKRILKFNDYKNYLLKNEIILKSQQRFKSEAHNVFTEEINDVALSSNDDKRLQTFDKITSFSYDTSVGKICEIELLE